jgi:hypothetical protein
MIINIHCIVEAVSKALFRHCELRGMKQEAIHKSLLMDWIASVFDLAMTVKRAFDTPSQGAVCTGRGERFRAESPVVNSTGQRPVDKGDLPS